MLNVTVFPAGIPTTRYDCAEVASSWPSVNTTRRQQRLAGVALSLNYLVASHFKDNLTLYLEMLYQLRGNGYRSAHAGSDYWLSTERLAVRAANAEWPKFRRQLCDVGSAKSVDETRLAEIAAAWD